VPQRALMASLGGASPFRAASNFTANSTSASRFRRHDQGFGLDGSDSPTPRRSIRKATPLRRHGGDFGFGIGSLIPPRQKERRPPGSSLPGRRVMFSERVDGQQFGSVVSARTSEPHDLVRESGHLRDDAILPYTDIASERRASASAFRFAGTGYAMVSDEDNHLLRTNSPNRMFRHRRKVVPARTLCDHQSFLCPGSSRLFGFYVTGTQNQSYYDGPNLGETASIDSSIFSVQAMFTLAPA